MQHALIFKYIFNKCGTNIYFFTLHRFGPSPSGYETGANSEIPLPGYADASGFFSKIPLKGYKVASPSTDQSASYSDSTSSGYGADKYLKTSLSEYQAGVNSEIPPPGYAEAPPSND